MISAFNLIGKYEPVEVIFYRGMLKRTVVFSLLSIPKLNGIYFHHMYLLRVVAWICLRCSAGCGRKIMCKIYLPLFI